MRSMEGRPEVGMSNGRGGINRCTARLNAELELDPAPELPAGLAQGRHPEQEGGSAAGPQQTRSASVQRLQANVDAQGPPPGRPRGLGTGTGTHA